MRVVFIILCLAFFTACASTGKVDEAKKNDVLNIKFENRFGVEPIEMGKEYTNAFGEKIIVTVFKYYISNIKFGYEDGSEVKVENQYFLINAIDNNSLAFDVPLSKPKPKNISFMVGVDSLRNVSGVQEGALDPAKGMFWTWNSGYIMAKLEGNSPASASINNKVELHIGGFQMPHNTVRKITLPLSKDYMNTYNNQLKIYADAAKFFNGAHDLRISSNAICTTPGSLAAQYAENYGYMFSLE